MNVVGTQVSISLYSSVPIICFSTFSCTYTHVCLIITFQSHERSVTKQLGPCGIIEISSLLRLTLAVEAIGNGVCDVRIRMGNVAWDSMGDWCILSSRCLERIKGECDYLEAEDTGLMLTLLE